MKPADSSVVELAALIDLFYEESDQLGLFRAVASDELPQSVSNLLAHDHHMTVTVEQHHGCPVDVEVLSARHDGDHYSRKILLRRQSDNAVVMFGIVRMDLSVMSREVRSEIESQSTPLGRILIEHQVLRSVKLVELFEIATGDELRQWLSPVCYGRTALIYCDNRPAIELLEVVSSVN